MEKEIQTPNFVNDHADHYYEQKAEQISAQLGRKIENSRQKIRSAQLRISVGCMTLLAAGTIFGLVKNYQYQHQPIQIIKTEGAIHAGKAEMGGNTVNPNLRHDCQLEDKSIEKSINDRIRDYALKTGYSMEQACQFANNFEQLYNDHITPEEYQEKVEEIAKK